MSDRASVIEDMRRFNRFYTHTIGLLDETLTQSAFSLTEARVLFELGHGVRPVVPNHTGWHGVLSKTFHLDAGVAASDIAKQLRVDAAYLARILRKFSADGLIEVRNDEKDGRRRILSLTPAGLTALDGLQAAAKSDIANVIADLNDAQAAELSWVLRKAARLLGDTDVAAPLLQLRAHQPGDIGWVIGRQTQLYAKEYGWDGEYEALACEICAKFLRDFVPAKEFCWVAERGGERLGAIFLVRRSDEEGQLRLLHVEAAARGMGVGTKLVEACVETARKAGYRKLVLWTNDVLAAARHIYERAGFELVSEEAHHSFGKDLHGQMWALDLTRSQTSN